MQYVLIGYLIAASGIFAVTLILIALHGGGKR